MHEQHAQGAGRAARASMCRVQSNGARTGAARRPVLSDELSCDFAEGSQKYLKNAKRGVLLGERRRTFLCWVGGRSEHYKSWTVCVKTALMGSDPHLSHGPTSLSRTHISLTDMRLSHRHTSLSQTCVSLTDMRLSHRHTSLSHPDICDHMAGYHI